MMTYRELLYLDGVKLPRQPQAQAWYTSKEKVSGNFGGSASARKDLQRRSASRLVIMPHLRDDTGMAPARRSSSSCTGVH